MKQLLETIVKPSWKIRRRLINATLAFCGVELVVLTAALFVGIDPGMLPLAQTLAWGAFGAGMSVLGSYIFGATWDDKNHRGRNWRDWDRDRDNDWGGRDDRHDEPNNSEEPG